MENGAEHFGDRKDNFVVDRLGAIPPHAAAYRAAQIHQDTYGKVQQYCSLARYLVVVVCLSGPYRISCVRPELSSTCVQYMPN